MSIFLCNISGTIDAVNDIGSTDYTGFSLLGEDLLGDLFGSTSSKKTNKKKNIKKQAPTSSTTTTKKPRSTRRPARRPTTKSTTIRSTTTRSTTTRPTRSTTTRKPRPSGYRRPTRRPSPHRKRKPTTENTLTLVLTTTTTKPVVSTVSAAVPTTELTSLMNTIQTANLAAPSVVDDPYPVSVLPVTTPKIVSDLGDPGLQMSLAHITGQLSVMPTGITPMIADESKQSAVINNAKETIYEKIQTITPKTSSTRPFASFSEEDFVTDDIIPVGQNMEPQDMMSESEHSSDQESEDHKYNAGSLISDNYTGSNSPKKTKGKQFNLHDLDVLDLSKIGESLGDELGIFGKNKKHKDNKNPENRPEKDHKDDYDDLVDAIGHTLMMNKSDKGNKNKKDRRRQNKMMRGEWSIQPVTS